ncbi:MAG: general secretion pathway protein GspL, partial [Congregibacter sp.]|nr:general secretion pathway protein GspL [Congregibacter sp.]
MAVQGNQWMLFGIDMRQFVQQWMSAWRELLLSESSPIRQRLDEPVLLYRGAETQLFQGGRALADSACRLSGCTAHVLPDELVLSRVLSIPAAAEAELPAVLAMEVAAASPFKSADTVYGWRETSRDLQSLHLILAIASRPAIERWKRDRDFEPPLQHAPVTAVGSGTSAAEIWAEVGGVFVTLVGFGEARREQAYRRRLWQMGLLGGGALALILVSAAMFAMQQRSTLEGFERLQNKVQLDSRSVSDMRATLVDANETVRA